MHLRPACHDRQLLPFRARLDEGALELEDAQEIHEIALDVAQPAEVIQLVRGEAQGAQCVQFRVDLRQQFRERKNRRIAATKRYSACVCGWRCSNACHIVNL